MPQLDRDVISLRALLVARQRELLARVTEGAQSDEILDGLAALAEGAREVQAAENAAATLQTDLVGTIVQVDDAFAHLLGYRAFEIEGSEIQRLAPGEDHDDLIRRLLAAPNAEICVARRYRTRDGDARMLHERWGLHRDDAGCARSAQARVEGSAPADAHPLGRLSPRERDVLERVVAGCTSRRIGEDLGISAATVNTYRVRLMAKLGVRRVPALMRVALEYGVQSCGVPFHADGGFRTATRRA